MHRQQVSVIKIQQVNSLRTSIDFACYQKAMRNSGLLTDNCSMLIETNSRAKVIKYKNNVTNVTFVTLGLLTGLLMSLFTQKIK